jgi:hypothetical protein
VPALEELSLTDLDPDHLARLLPTLELPRLATLALDLPDQDFTGVVQMMAGVSALPALISAPAPSLPIAALHTLRITALECEPAALAALLRALIALCVLELDFARVRNPNAVGDVLLESLPLPLNMENTGSEEETTCECEESRCVPVLPLLEEARLFGLAGERVRALLAFRARFAEGCQCDGGGSECPPSSASSSCSSRSSSAPGSPADSTHVNSNGIGSELGGHGRAAMPRFVVRWSSRRQGRDTVLEQLVRQGRVGWVDEDEGEDDDGNEEEDSSDEGEGEDESTG